MNDLKRGIILRDRDTCIYKDIGGLITIQTHTPNCTVIFAKIHLFNLLIGWGGAFGRAPKGPYIESPAGGTLSSPFWSSTSPHHMNSEPPKGLGFTYWVGGLLVEQLKFLSSPLDGGLISRAPKG